MDRMRADRPDVIRAFERDMELVNNLKHDPEQQHTLFRKLPVWPTSLKFYDCETEWHYHSHLLDSTRRTYVDSQKVAPIADVIMCFMIILSTVIVCLFLQHTHRIASATFYLLCLLNILICFGVSTCLIFVSTTYEDRLKSARLRQTYQLLIRPFSRELCTAIVTMTPTVVLCLFNYLCSSYDVAIGKRSLFAAISFHCMLIHCVPTSSAAWTRTICAVITYALITEASQCMAYVNIPGKYCLGRTYFVYGIAYGKFCTVYNVEWLLCMVLVIFISRENERNCRRCFYVSREAEIAVDAAEKAVTEAQDLLYNIIPKYVFDHLKLYQKDKSFSYAVSVAHAGVAFATISNFFSKYYREDYKGGENALKLLNSIICMFDELLELPQMKDVEKVKTINDCYMVAAGLNREEVKRNPSNEAHLVALMEYCHMIVESLNEFNEMYIIGTDNFEVKIGYNSGPLIAGIIGTTKPMYDIWGNTVNVASRMYSTGLVGKIQVPQHVAEELREYFTFTYRGEIFVKGKGDMQTYLCDRNK